MTWQKSLRTKVNKQLIDVMTVSTYVYHGTSSMQKNVGKKMLCIICRTQFSLMDYSSFIKALFVEFRKDRMFLYERKTTNKEKLG